MTKRRQRYGGRPPGPNGARTLVVPVKLSQRELAAIQDAVARENAEIAKDGGDGATATVSSWIRDHALDPLGLATFRAEDGDS